MMNEPIDLQRVRFKVYHGGFGCHPGECMHVRKDWAEKAIAAGIVEDATEDRRAEPKPGA